MTHFCTDMSQWPIVVHHSDGVMGPEQTQLLLDALTATLARNERHVSVFESTKLTNYERCDRDRIVSWMKHNDPLLQQYTVATAVVLESAALRFAIAAVMLLYRPKWPIKVFGSLNSALVWARAQLQTDAMRISKTG